tara:strand:- start:63 stop:740 length:678 start_codon:yes stop_codon:yes gene_type:complete
MSAKFSLIIDFDSTIIGLETLEYLADISTNDSSDKKKLISQISHYTNLAMNGDITFEQSLDLRFDLIKLNRQDINNSISYLKNKIDTSFLDNINFFKKHFDSIYIVSGGFKSIIHSVLNSALDADWNVYANEFVFDDKGNVKGVEEGNPLSLSKGKVELVKSLNLDNDIIIVGDGYTDYEIKKFNVAKYFLAYTAHIKRNNVINNADVVCSDFYDVIEFIEKKYI